MKSKVLLVNPVIGFSPPFGLLYIASVLEKHGYHVKIEELNTYGKKHWSFEGLMRRIKCEEVDVVGIVCLSAYVEVVKRLIAELKLRFPGVKVIIGGTHASALPEEMIGMGADVVVIGEGEMSFLNILQKLDEDEPLRSVPSIVFVDNGKAVATSKREDFEDVRGLPWPAYHLININRYFENNYAIRGYWLRCGWVFSARGCPGRCTFCASAITHGFRLRERDIKDVVEELVYLKDKYKIEAFWILDDTFVIKEERVRKFCEEIKNKKLNLIWACQARVNYFTENLARLLKENGCVQVDFGIESGSQKVLNKLKKGITIEQTRRAFRLAHKYNLRALGTIMIGCPDENWEDIKKTERLLAEVKPDYLGIGYCTPYPGCELYKEAVQNKWLDIDQLIWDTEGHNAQPIMFVNFSKEELHSIYQSLMKDSFYKTLIVYFKQPRFIKDMIKTVLFHPKVVFRMVKLSLTGKRREVLNTFRTYRITGDV